MEMINREISWLSFNDRVLQEANDPNVPLIERLKFLGIFSSNLDEFFQIRVATVKRLTALGKKGKKIMGDDPKKIMKQIQKSVINQQKNFDRSYSAILKELERNNILIINEKQLTPEQGEFVTNYFKQEVQSALVPLMIDRIKEFPPLKDQAIYLAVYLSDSKRKHPAKYALLEIPTDIVSRFVILPYFKDNHYIMLLDDVIRYSLKDIFYIFPHDTFKAFTIKLTRDLELDLDDDLSESMLQKITKGIKQRKVGKPVRFIYDASINPELLKYLLKRMKLNKDNDNVIAGARYHNFRDFMNFPDLGNLHLRYQKIRPLPHPNIKPGKSLFYAIKRQDILLTYPYHSFDHFLDFLREASIDPNVKSIKITLYRVTKYSKVVNALVNAVKNGKEVKVLVELQARFDEQNNIDMANRLKEEGAKIILGVPGLKVHSKLCLITRVEDGKNVNYVNFATGNYNESTAKLYSDHSLFTADRKIAEEVEHMFQFFENNFRISNYKHLVVSPHQMRKKLIKLIDNEIENAQSGKDAYILLKLNNIVDREMIDALYSASKAGVKIKLNVRGICSLIPALPGISENIEGISIVDKFLEHSRVLIFCNGGDEKYYISSADFMSRSLFHRVEVAVPIYDKRIQSELKRYFNIQWSDNVKARVIDAEEQNIYRKKVGRSIRAQEAIYEFLKSQSKS
jgi:polyphosphate kinase